MLDLLIALQRNAQIDDNGIREEVDTFIFEVLYIYINYYPRINNNNNLRFFIGIWYNSDGFDSFFITSCRTSGCAGKIK